MAKFPKQTTRLNLISDLNLSMYSDLPNADSFWVEVWSDPAKSLLGNLAHIFTIKTKSDDEQEASLNNKDAEEYFDTMSRIILGSNIDGLSFEDGNSETMIANYDSPDVPGNFMFNIGAAVFMYIMDQQTDLKKILHESLKQ